MNIDFTSDELNVSRHSSLETPLENTSTQDFLTKSIPGRKRAATELEDFSQER